MTKASIDKNHRFMCECDDFSYKVAPSPDFEFEEFKVSELMPENGRIKQTLDKMVKKLKGTNGGTLICCVPPESGQSSAKKIIDELSSKNRYQKVHNVITIDIRDTFEDEHLLIWNQKNPNYDTRTLRWSKTERVFKVSL